MGLLASLLVVVGYPTETRYFTVVALRHVAATDAARVVNSYAAGHQLHAVATADATANRVRVEGDATPIRQVNALLADLDRPQPQATCRLLYVRTPAGFAETVGLGDSGNGAWTLTPREARMFVAAVGQAARRRAADILARPILMVGDNQTGHFHLGEASGDLAAADVTPRLEPDGRFCLRLSTRIGEGSAMSGTTVRRVSEVQATALLSSGEAMVVRVPMPATADRAAAEVFILATVERFEPELAR